MVINSKIMEADATTTTVSDDAAAQMTGEEANKNDNNFKQTKGTNENAEDDDDDDDLFATDEDEEDVKPPPSSTPSKGSDEKDQKVTTSGVQTLAPPGASNEKSSSKFGLPEGVTIPSSINGMLLQGKLLETLKSLPVNSINDALTEYDDAVQIKGAAIRNHGAYLYGVIKRYVAVQDRAEVGVLPMGPELTPTVQERLQRLVSSGFCTADEMNDKIKSKIRMLSEKDALEAIEELASVDRRHIRTFGSYFMGILNKKIRGPDTGSGASNQGRPQDHGRRNSRDEPRGRYGERRPGNDRNYRESNRDSYRRDRSRDRYDDNQRNDRYQRNGHDRDLSRYDARLQQQQPSQQMIPPPPPQTQRMPGYPQQPQQPFGQLQQQQHQMYPQNNNHQFVSSMGQGMMQYQQNPQNPQSNIPGMHPMNPQQNMMQPQNMMPPQMMPGQPMQQQQNYGQQQPVMMGQMNPLMNNPQQNMPQQQQPQQQQQQPGSYNPPYQSHIWQQQPGSFQQPPPQQQQHQGQMPVDVLGLADQVTQALSQNRGEYGRPPLSSGPNMQVAPPTPQIPYRNAPHSSMPYQNQQRSQGGQHQNRSRGRATTTATMNELPPMVQYSVQNLQATGQVGKLDEGILGMIKDLPEQLALAALQKFSSLDKSTMRNTTAYLAGVLRKELVKINRR